MGILRHVASNCDWSWFFVNFRCSHCHHLGASQPESDATDPMIPEPGREGLRRRGQEEECEKRPMSEMMKGCRQRRALPGDCLRNLVSL
jgi:hypothetical protein